MTEEANREEQKKGISTHTSLAGRDYYIEGYPKTVVISTHTSLAGRDTEKRSYLWSVLEFLLTRPSRDVTNCPG